MSQIRLIAIRDTALSVDEVRNAIADPAAGGEVLFVGTVRDNDAEKGVIGLAYSAHPSAEAELRKVTAGIVAKFPDVIGSRRCTGLATWPWATRRLSSGCPARTGQRPSTPATR